jgi:anti-sigma regulatory factor (Ser/Thr protein kinase)
MLLDNSKRDFIQDNPQEETTKMSISADVESHIIRVLTEHSYDDPLGSSIREAVSNAVDSVTEAGTKMPVIVSIVKTKDKGYEFMVEDKGLGLDDVSFKKYIMGIGESTKRNSDILLGGYGAGAKAWLSYTNSFSYVCRKNGVERKYLIFKGEEFPECTLLYEKPTTEVNGVIVIVKLKDSHYEVETCKRKIREQLAYLDNVYYNIPDFDNTYKIYRTQHFQFSPLKGSCQMHISLKNIVYSIDWDKIGMVPLDIPIALRFDDYSKIKPIFNRESLQYTSSSIKAIKEAITNVANYFANEWNSSLHEFQNFRNARPSVRQSRREISLFDGKLEFNAEYLLLHSSIKALPPKVVDVPDAVYFANLREKVLNGFNAIGFNEGSRWSQKNIHHKFEHYYLDPADNWYKDYKAVIVDFNVSGYLKEYLKEKYTTPTMYLKEKESAVLLAWTKNVKLPNDMNVQDFERQALIIHNHYKQTFIDETGLPNKQEFLDWKEAKIKAVKAGRIPKTQAPYVTIDKQKGEITCRWTREMKRGEGITYDPVAVSIESVCNPTTYKKLVVYTTETFPISILSFNKILFVKLNSSEVKHVKDLKHFMHMDTFKKSKPMARLATTIFIEDLLESFENCQEIVVENFPAISTLRTQLEIYKARDEFNTSKIERSVKNIILEEARNNANWDLSIFDKVQQFEKHIKSFAFMAGLKQTDSWRTSHFEKKMAITIMFIMLKHQKVHHKLLEQYDLVEKPVVSPEAEEEKQIQEITEQIEVV